MTVPPHPLSRPHLDQLAGLVEPNGFPLGVEEIEARAQILWNEFLKHYFSGQPFTTPAAGGGEGQKTFEHCDLLFDRDSPPDPAPLPLIHLIVADRRRVRETTLDLSGQRLRCDQEAWTWHLLVRTGAQQPVTPGQPLKDTAGEEAERINRRVAAQVDWLLRSPEGQALALKGIGRLAVPGPPRIIPSGGWCLRQLVVTATLHVRAATNPPV